MSLLRVVKVTNGDRLVNYAFYKCDKCSCELPEQYPRYDIGNVDYCFECSFKQGLIDEKLFLDSGTGYNSFMFRAGVNPESGEINVWFTNEVTPWLRKPKQDRHSKQYTDWRTKVFERDNYTCQECNQRGGTLNAHHVKPFAKFKKHRFVLENGITLCEVCHRKRHGSKIGVKL